MAIPAIPDIPNPADGVRGTTCQDLEAQLDEKIAVLEQAKEAMNAPTKLLNKELGKLIGGPASSAGDILAAKDTIQGGVDDNTPAIPNTDEIENMLKDCGLLSDNILSGKTSPAAAVGDFVKKAGDAVEDAIGKALEAISNLLEAPAATIINAINDILDKIKVPDVLGALDGILNCLDAMCGSDVSGKVDYVNTLASDMKIDDNGALDVDTLFSEAGIDQGQADNIKEIGTKIADAKSSAQEQAASSGEALGGGIKELVKPPPAAQKVISFFS